MNTGPGIGSQFGIPFKTVVGRWYHIVGVSSGEGTGRIFVNGELVGTDAYVNGENLDQPVRIGVADTLCCGFTGAIDEVAIYRTQLSPTQIAAHYAAAFRSCESLADVAGPFGILDLADINAFTAGFLAMDPIADLNADGLFDLGDINLFVESFTAGCP